jgi:hypothetical protein
LNALCQHVAAPAGLDLVTDRMGDRKLKQLHWSLSDLYW